MFERARTASKSFTSKVDLLLRRHGLCAHLQLASRGTENYQSCVVFKKDDNFVNRWFEFGSQRSPQSYLSNPRPWDARAWTLKEVNQLVHSYDDPLLIRLVGCHLDCDPVSEVPCPRNLKLEGGHEVVELQISVGEGWVLVISFPLRDSTIVCSLKSSTDVYVGRPKFTEVGNLILDRLFFFVCKFLVAKFR